MSSALCYLGTSNLFETPQLDAVVCTKWDHLWTNKHRNKQKFHSCSSSLIDATLSWCSSVKTASKSSAAGLVKEIYSHQKVFKMRWGWSSRSSPELGLRRIRKLKGRKDAQDRKKSIAVKESDKIFPKLSHLFWVEMSSGSVATCLSSWSTGCHLLDALKLSKAHYTRKDLLQCCSCQQQSTGDILVLLN